jgi:hypothetical protein
MLCWGDYFFWVVGFLFEIYIVVFSIFRREFFRYFPVNFYMMCAALVETGAYACIRRFGFASTHYAYYYYYTDSLLTIVMLTVIIQLYLEVFKEMRVSRYVKGAALIVIVAAGLVSYALVHQNMSQLTSRFVLSLTRNLNFVGVVFTYILWGAIVKLRETRARLVQLILALGVFYSGTAVTYALRNLFPATEMRVLRWVPPLLGAWLPLAWAYTFTRVPEDARVITSPVMAGER